jgi:hypothetical protein
MEFIGDLADFFTSCSPLATLAIISIQYRQGMLARISTDKPACVNRFRKLQNYGEREAPNRRVTDNPEVRPITQHTRVYRY